MKADSFKEKQLFADVLQNKCSKFRNIHRKKPVLEFLFNKVAGLNIAKFLIITST